MMKFSVVTFLRFKVDSPIAYRERKTTTHFNIIQFHKRVLFSFQCGPKPNSETFKVVAKLNCFSPSISSSYINFHGAMPSEASW